MDHRGDFAMLVQRKLGPEIVATIDWSGPRLLCIAGDFTRYDEHAVKQIARSIELIRYRSFGDGLLMIELVHNPREIRASRSNTGAEPRINGRPNDIDLASAVVESRAASGGGTPLNQQIAYRISQTHGELKELFDAAYEFLEALGDDVQVRQQKLYVAFKRIKNFACLEVYPQARVVTVHVKVDPSTITLEPGFTRDVRNIGHFGTGDLEISIRNMDEFRKAQPLFQLSYDNS
jgi:predicted transport protein